MFNFQEISGITAKINYLLAEGYKIEAKGRSIAANRDEYISEEDSEFFQSVERHGWKLREVVGDFLWEINQTLASIFADACQAFIDYAHIMDGFIFGILDKGAKIPRKTPLVKIADYLYDPTTAEKYRYEIAEAFAEAVKIPSEQMYRLTGKKCTWLYGAVPLEQYSYSALVNDFTSCYHHLLNYIGQNFSTVIEFVRGRVVALPNYSQELLEYTRRWWNAFEFYRFNLKIYSIYDAAAVRALVKDTAAEYKVGSSPGHATHIEIANENLLAHYYDIDNAIHQVFQILCRYYGYIISEYERSERTTVLIPRANAIPFFEGVLPFVTSMDYRLQEPSYWPSWILDKAVTVKIEGPIEAACCIVAYEYYKSSEEYRLFQTGFVGK